MTRTYQALVVMHLGFLTMLIFFIPMMATQEFGILGQKGFGGRLRGSIRTISTILFVAAAVFTFAFTIMYFTSSLGTQRILQQFVSVFRLPSFSTPVQP